MGESEPPSPSGLSDELGDTGPFGAAMRATRVPMIICDAREGDAPILFANDAFLLATGHPAEDVIGRNCRFLQGPDTDRETVERIRHAVRDRIDIHVELLNYRRDGSTFWNALFVGPVRDDAGEIRYFFGSQVDVTTRKEGELRVRAEKVAVEVAVAERTRSLQVALDARNTLLHEVDHRVKNNLQTIASLIAMERRGVTDPTGRDAFARLVRRVEAVAIVHRRLYENREVDRFDVAGFARALLDQLGTSLGASVEQHIDPEPILVAASDASPLALMFNELLLQAAATGAGPVSVSVGRLDDERFLLRVSPAVDEAADSSLPGGGARGELVRRLVRQLRGDVERAGGEVRISLSCDARPR